MKLEDAVVLVTGANRGIGLALAREALDRCARKVYAAARDPSRVDIPGAQPILLDVKSEEDVKAAATHCTDVTIVINNAGIANFGGAMMDGSLESAREQMEVNYFGMLRMSRAFAPILARQGGGALVNVLSVASWVHRPLLGIYGSTKAAAWGLTNSLRHELRTSRTQVLAAHFGFVDTDLTRGIDAPKATPQQIAQRVLDALESGAEEVLADDRTEQVKRGLSAEPGIYLQA